MNKIEAYKDNQQDFLNEIIIMLSEFNIKTSKIERFRPSVIRKDNKKTYSTRFFVSTSSLNTIAFSHLISYPFNEEKRIALLEAVREANIKLKRMQIQVDKYKKALKLNKEGLSNYKIAKIVNVQWHTANNWINKKEHLPTLLNQNKVML